MVLNRFLLMVFASIDRSKCDGGWAFQPRSMLNKHYKVREPESRCFVIVKHDIRRRRETPLIMISQRCCRYWRDSNPRCCAGNILFAFTDGAADCTDLHGDFLGRDRLRDVLQQTSASAHELVKVIEAELR